MQAFSFFTVMRFESSEGARVQPALTVIWYVTDEETRAPKTKEAKTQLPTRSTALHSRYKTASKHPIHTDPFCFMLLPLGTAVFTPWNPVLPPCLMYTHPLILSLQMGTKNLSGMTEMF